MRISNYFNKYAKTFKYYYILPEQGKYINFNYNNEITTIVQNKLIISTLSFQVRLDIF